MISYLERDGEGVYMSLGTFQLKNFRSFCDSTEHQFRHSMQVWLGKRLGSLTFRIISSLADTDMTDTNGRTRGRAK